MRTVWPVLLVVLLLCVVPGCGGDAAVETPGNPAPKPEMEPVPVSNSLPADSAPADSDR
jgi:hypothetical protein